MTQAGTTILGIETSCDETAAAIVRVSGDASDRRVEVLSDLVASQFEDHRAFGGVVPEIAARAHVERLDGLILGALDQSGLDWSDLDGVAATAGPGLIGGVMVGLSTAKAIALARGVKFCAINHLEGHALSPRLETSTPFPYLLLLVSGGHCQFLSVTGLGAYQRLGSTIDDAAGEAFDKTAKLLGLGFPGGPAVERAARTGDPQAVSLPRPLLSKQTLDMSFAGLKTAVRRAADAEATTPERIADLCASFQAAVADILGVRARQAMDVFSSLTGDSDGRLVVAGGVAANAELRSRLRAEAMAAGFEFIAPPLNWCTDNAAMIALAGAERLMAGLDDPLDAPARSRWPLDARAAVADPASGGGKRGAKA